MGLFGKASVRTTVPGLWLAPMLLVSGCSAATSAEAIVSPTATEAPSPVAYELTGEVQASVLDGVLEDCFPGDTAADRLDTLSEMIGGREYPCRSGSGPIYPGSTVVVRGSDGTIIASGKMRGIKVGGPEFLLWGTYTVKDVPESDFYEVEIGGLTTTVAFEQLEDEDWRLDLQLR